MLAHKTLVCVCFDAAHQLILYLNTHALLTEHEHFVTSTQDVQHHLNDITALIGTLLNGRDYWVLVEQQYLDQDAKAGLYFNLQLQMLIEMYYLQKGTKGADCACSQALPLSRHPRLEARHTHGPQKQGGQGG